MTTTTAPRACRVRVQKKAAELEAIASRVERGLEQPAARDSGGPSAWLRVTSARARAAANRERVEAAWRRARTPTHLRCPGRRARPAAGGYPTRPFARLNAWLDTIAPDHDPDADPNP